MIYFDDWKNMTAMKGFLCDFVFMSELVVKMRENSGFRWMGVKISVFYCFSHWKLILRQILAEFKRNHLKIFKLFNKKIVVKKPKHYS